MGPCDSPGVYALRLHRSYLIEYTINGATGSRATWVSVSPHARAMLLRRLSRPRDSLLMHTPGCKHIPAGHRSTEEKALTLPATGAEQGRPLSLGLDSLS